MSASPSLYLGVVRDAQAGGTTRLLQPRWAYSFMRGPMTRQEIASAREAALRSARAAP